MHAARLLLLALCALSATTGVGAEEEEEELQGSLALFSVGVEIDGAMVQVAVHEGDVIADLARRVGKERGLAADAVMSVQQMITRKAAEVLGERAVKTVFFGAMLDHFIRFHLMCDVKPLCPLPFDVFG